MEGCGHMGAVLIYLGGKPKTSNLHMSKNRLKSFKICIFLVFFNVQSATFHTKYKAEASGASRGRKFLEITADF